MSGVAVQVYMGALLMSQELLWKQLHIQCVGYYRLAIKMVIKLLCSSGNGSFMSISRHIHGLYNYCMAVENGSSIYEHYLYILMGCWSYG